MQKFYSHDKSNNDLSVLFDDYDAIPTIGKIHQNANKRKTLVVIFSKDDSLRLKNTLPKLTKLPLNIILLDDSTNKLTKKIYDKKFQKTNIVYHGPMEQLTILKKLKISKSNHHISKLGTKGWTLGNCRNYALLLAMSLGYENLLMIDNDIFASRRTICNTLALLSSYDIVGAVTKGMPDDSMAGYLFRDIGVRQFDFVTGQYLALRLDSIRNFFPNTYNEDLLFMLFESKTNNIARCGTIKQMYYDQFSNIKSKSTFQEFGEILFMGIKSAVLRRDLQLLYDPSFWDATINDRKSEIQILKKNLGSEFKLADFFFSLYEYHDKLTPMPFIKFIREYFYKLSTWNTLCERARVLGKEANLSMH